jgi:hypothetical protein
MHRETSTADFNIFLFAGSDSHFAATVGLGVTDIPAADSEKQWRLYVRDGRGFWASGPIPSFSSEIQCSRYA